MPRVDNESFYLTAVSEHGETAEGLQWNSVESQEVRFRVLRSFLPDDLSELTLVDAGCGFGDFYLYLERLGERPGRYIGIDALAHMVETARTRTGCEIHVLDVLADTLPAADYYLCSGAMNTLTRGETHRFIQNCYESSASAFVFNLLKGWNNSSIYNFYLPRDIVRLAQEMGADCRLHEGYLAGDFTAAFFKTPAEAEEAE